MSSPDTDIPDESESQIPQNGSDELNPEIEYDGLVHKIFTQNRYSRRGVVMFVAGFVAGAAAAGSFPRNVSAQGSAPSVGAGTAAGEPRVLPQGSNAESYIPTEIQYNNLDGSVVTEKINILRGVTVENEEGQLSAEEIEAKVSAATNKINTGKAAKTSANQSNPIVVPELTDVMGAPRNFSNLLFLPRVVVEKQGIEPKTVDRIIEESLESIIGNDITFGIYVYDPSTKTYVVREFKDLDEDIKPIIGKYPQALLFYQRAISSVKAAARNVDQESNLKLLDGLDNYYLIVNKGSPVSETGVTILSLDDDGIPHQIELGFSDLEAFMSETPHGTGIMNRKFTDKDQEVLPTIDAVGAHDNVVVEGVSNLADSGFTLDGERLNEADMVLLLSQGGTIGRSLYQLLRQEYLSTHEIKQADYQHTFEADGVEFTNIILDEFPELTDLYNVLIAGQYSGMTDAQYNNLVDMYAGVVGISRLMKTLECPELNLDNIAVEDFLNNFPNTEIRPRLLKIFEKLKERGFISNVKYGDITSMVGDSQVLTRVRNGFGRNPDPVFLQMGDFEALSAETVTVGENASIKVGEATLIKDGTLVYGKVIKDGVEQYVDMTAVCTIRATDDFMPGWFAAPKNIKIDGKLYPIADRSYLVISKWDCKLNGTQQTKTNKVIFPEIN